MKERPRLVVTTGLHAGACVELEEDHDLRIGSATDADLILADTDVAPHHATVRLHAGRLALRATSDNVDVFGRPLKPTVHALLRHGALFSLGNTTLQFSNGEPLTEDAAPRAERAWLFRHAPLAWLIKRLTTLPRHVWLLLAALPLIPALWQGLSLFAPQPLPPHAPLLGQRAFRGVRMHIEKETGRRIYEGYVQTAGELAALALAARAEGGANVLRVAVIDAMHEQLSDFLDRYYRGARVKAGTPGTFVAALPDENAYLQPESWDYARLAGLARIQVDGLQSLQFAGHESDHGPVRIPLEALGLNLVSTPHAAWLADAHGIRYFVGARISVGRITSITGSGATIVRDDGSVYGLSAAHTALARPS